MASTRGLAQPATFVTWSLSLSSCVWANDKNEAAKIQLIFLLKLTISYMGRPPKSPKIRLFFLPFKSRFIMFHHHFKHFYSWKLITVVTIDQMTEAVLKIPWTMSYTRNSDTNTKHSKTWKTRHQSSWALMRSKEPDVQHLIGPREIFSMYSRVKYDFQIHVKECQMYTYVCIYIYIEVLYDYMIGWHVPCVEVYYILVPEYWPYVHSLFLTPTFCFTSIYTLSCG